MNETLIQGFGLMIVGMSLVFIFLTTVFVIVLFFKKFDTTKAVTLAAPQTTNETDIHQLEKTAAIAGAIIYLNTRHPSLVYSESLQDTKIKQLNWFSKKYKE